MHTEFLVVKPEGKRPYRRPMQRLEKTVKMGLSIYCMVIWIIKLCTMGLQTRLLTLANALVVCFCDAWSTEPCVNCDTQPIKDKRLGQRAWTGFVWLRMRSLESSMTRVGTQSDLRCDHFLIYCRPPIYFVLPVVPVPFTKCSVLHNEISS
jgi:hypothetical protein